MASKKTRLNVHLTNQQVDNVLKTFEVTELVNTCMTDLRVQKLFNVLGALFNQEYPNTMPKVNRHVKGDFFQDFSTFSQRLELYLKRAFAEFALEEFAATGDITRASKRIQTKASEFFTQRLHLVYEDTAYNIKVDKVLNGQQTVEWLL